MCISTETPIYWKFKDKILNLFEAPNQRNCCVTLLWKFFQGLIVFCVNEVFKYNKLAVHFKLTLGMIFVVLCKYSNCAADKTIDKCHTASTDCN